MRKVLRTFLFTFLALALSLGVAQADAVLVEAAHTLTKLVDSVALLDPSHSDLETLCQFSGSDIESIGVDPASGVLYVQLQFPPGAFTISCHIRTGPAGSPRM